MNHAVDENDSITKCTCIIIHDFLASQEKCVSLKHDAGFPPTRKNLFLLESSMIQ